MLYLAVEQLGGLVRDTGLRPLVELDLRHLHVLGHVHDHRAGTAAGRDAEGLGDDPQQVLGGPDQEIVLGDGHGQAVGVHLLKGIGADHGQGHLAGDADDRDGVELGVGNGRQGVGRARPGGGEEDRGLARDPGHALGDEPGPLFVPGQNVFDVAALPQGVIERQIRSARDTGNGPHTLPFQQFDGYFRT